MASDLAGIVVGEMERVATGFTFTEGPLWHPAGYWLFADVRESLTYRLAPGGEPEVVRRESGRGNGHTFDLAGRVVVCEGEGRRIARLEPDGTYSTVVDRWQGKRLNRPNDIVGAADGSLYFTDPQTPPQLDWEQASGAVFRVGPDGTIDRLLADLPFPNGLALAPDDRTLYVINTASSAVSQPFPRADMHIRAYALGLDGRLGGETLRIPMDSSHGEGGPDGMKVDSAGRLFSTGPGGIWVMEPDGRHLGTLPVPEVPSNCAWGGADYCTLFITARTSVYQVRVATPGLVPPGARRHLPAGR